jgi:hypothetical protein
MRKTACVWLASLFVGCASFGQTLPEAPAQHRFWDTPNKVLFLSHVALESADFAITHRNLSQGGREMNPMGKAMCESGTAGQLAFFGGRIAAVGGISYLFHRMRLHKLERVFIVAASADSASGIIYSSTH